MQHLLTWHGKIYGSENTKQYTVKFLKRSNQTAFWAYKGCQTKNFAFI